MIPTNLASYQAYDFHLFSDGNIPIGTAHMPATNWTFAGLRRAVTVGGNIAIHGEGFFEAKTEGNHGIGIAMASQANTGGQCYMTMKINGQIVSPKPMIDVSAITEPRYMLVQKPLKPGKYKVEFETTCTYTGNDLTVVVGFQRPDASLLPATDADIRSKD